MSSRHFYHYAIHVNAGDKGREVLMPKKGAPRSFLLVENRSAGTVIMNFDTPATLLDGILIPAGGVLAFDIVVPDNQLHFTGTVATGGIDQRVNITEAF